MASAQTTFNGTNRSTVNDSGVNNQATVSNATPGNDNNVSVITFEGRDNRATVDQVGDDNSSTSSHVGDSNTSRLRQTGIRNTASLLQAGNGNSSNIDQHLDPSIAFVEGRSAVVEQRGSNNGSILTQINRNNSATVLQGSAEIASQSGSSQIFQFSASNIARVSMLEGSAAAPNTSVIEQNRIDPTETRNFADVSIRGFGNGSNVLQMGQDSSTTIAQLGRDNRSRSSTIGNGSRSVVRQTGNGNSVSLNQADGDRNSSSIDQHLDPSIAIVGNRQASVEQHGSDNSSTLTQVNADNRATVVQGVVEPGRRLLSQGNISQILQFSAANTARVFMFDGSVQAPNKSVVEQTRIDPIVTRSLADVSIRGFGNESNIFQAGNEHVAELSMLGGGAGVDAATQRRLGNTSFIVQSSSFKGHSARVSIGTNVPQQGVGTVNRIEQRGDHRTISNDAIVWQRGQFTSLDIRQRIRGAQDDGGSLADIAQSGTLNAISVAQIGRHSAAVTQGLGQNSRLTLTQYDSGGGPRAGVPDDGTRLFSPGDVYRGNNSFLAAQYGDRNRIEGWQEGSDLSVTVWQKLGSSDNLLSLNQGRRNPQAGQFAFTSSATVTQDGRFNVSEVNQYSRDAGITVEQFGTGSAELPNRVTVRQFSLNGFVNVLQTAGVGPSSTGDPASGNSADQNRQATGDPSAPADPFYFAGGARSAEAIIFQSTTNSTATIEQRGRGQFASIEQLGTNNQASILQDVGATNATAVIRQEGSGNSYSVTQTRPGQYIAVSQTGTNNSVTNVVERPGG
jgi:hypothetical protein